MFSSLRNKSILNSLKKSSEKKPLLLLIIYFSVMQLMHSQNPHVSWARGMGAYAEDIATEKNGNTYMVGGFKSPTIVFGLYTLVNVDNNSNFFDMFIVKYNKTGNVIWAKRAGGSSIAAPPGDDKANDVAISPDGSVVVGGAFTTNQLTFGTTPITSLNYSGGKVCVAKYDSSGNALWVKGIPSTGGTPVVNSVAVDRSNNILITGSYRGSIVLDGITLTDGITTGDAMFVAKLDPSGHVLWAVSHRNTGDAKGKSITADKQNNVIVSGYTMDSLIIGSTAVLGYHSASYWWGGAYIIKYDSLGNVTWAKNGIELGTPCACAASGESVAVDTSGNVFMTGNFATGQLKFDTKTLFNSHPGYSYFYVVKFSAAGTALWIDGASEYPASNGNAGYDITTDSTGNAYVTGYSGNGTVAGSSIMGSFVVKYAPNGSPAWVRSFGDNSSANSGKGIATDRYGAVYVGGKYGLLPTAFGNDTLTPTASFNSFLLRICPNSSPVSISANGPTLFCQGDSVVLSASPAYQYLWNTGSTNQSIIVHNTGDYRATIFDPVSGCSDQSSAIHVTALSALAQSTLPYVQDFEGTTFTPLNWVLSNPDNDETWTRSATVGNNSSASVYINNYNGHFTGTNPDRLLTPSFSLSTSTTANLNFAVAYALYSAGLRDTLSVYVSTDCGLNWTKVYTKGGSALATAPNNLNYFIPNASQWRTESVNLTPFVGNSYVRIAFENKSAYGQVLYLDNIYISQTIIAGVTIVETSGTNPSCAGSSATFTAYPVNGGTNPVFDWQVNNVHVANGNIFSTSNLSDGDMIKCIMTSNLSGVLGSPATSNVITMQVNPAPTPPVVTAGGPLQFCTGDSVILTSSPAASYQWSNGITSQSTTVYSTQTDSVTITDNNGCHAGSSAISVVSYALPIIIASVSDSSVCSGESVVLSAIGGNSYTWSGGVTGGTAFVPVSTTTYTVTGTDVNNCSATTTALVTVNPVPTITVNPGTVSVCAGAPATLSGNGAVSYSWTGGIANGVAFTPLVTDTYTVTGTDANNCSDTAAVYVTVSSLPMVNASASSTSVCNGDTIVLTASGTGVFSWSGGIIDGTGFVPVVPDTFIVTATDVSGCSNTDSVAVDVHSCVWPGDANNDANADNNDIIELGLRYGASGIARASISNAWQSFDAPFWETGTVSSGDDINHADCDGDGTIDLNDTLAVNINYGLTHTLRLISPNQTNTTSDIYFNSLQTTYGYGQNVAIDVYLGQSTNPLQNFYGAAFTIDYSDNTMIQPGSLSFTIDNTNWVGMVNTNTIRLAKTDEINESIYGAISRIDHTNTSGYGKIGTIYFTTANTNGVFSVLASSAYYSDNAGLQTPLTSAGYSVTINPGVSLQENKNPLGLAVYPNPSNGSFSVMNLDTKADYSIEVKDILGKTVYSEMIKNPSTTKNIRVNSASGVYWLEIESGGHRSVHKLVIE